jgi:hypothetical protein
VRGWLGTPFARLVLLVSAYILWSVAFVALYAGHGLLCMQGGGGIVRPTLGLVVAALLAPHALLSWQAWVWRKRNGEQTLPLITFVIALSAIPATCWIALPVLMLTPCY